MNFFWRFLKNNVLENPSLEIYGLHGTHGTHANGANAVVGGRTNASLPGEAKMILFRFVLGDEIIKMLISPL